MNKDFVSQMRTMAPNATAGSERAITNHFYEKPYQS